MSLLGTILKVSGITNTKNGTDSGILGLAKNSVGKISFKRSLPILLITTVFGMDVDVTTNQLLVVALAALIYVGGKVADALNKKWSK